MEEELRRSNEELKALAEKKAAAEKYIRERHAAIVAAADKSRDEALASLHSASATVDREIADRLKEQEEKLEKLQKISRQLEQILHNGTDLEVLTFAEEMEAVLTEKRRICDPNALTK